MVSTQTVRGSVFAALLAGLLPACGSVVSTGENSAPPGELPGELPGETPPSAGTSYPGKGFIVHEWGTDTVVVGSDGSLQRGLHHEEEDLPSFVYDRIKGGSLAGSTSVSVKMETPVTYFYSDQPLTASVSVAFPSGVFTQWYPAVKGFYPMIAAPNAALGVDAYMDPALDVGFPFQQPMCAAKYSAVANGLLDWGSVEILPRGADVPMPDAPKDAFTWSYARDVDANGVRITGVPGAMSEAQTERFLFYRGLGNFELPLRVTSMAGGKVSAETTSKYAVGATFLLNVGPTTGAFLVQKEGISGSPFEATAPSLQGAPPLDTFVEALGEEVTATLDATGLYHDEAVAMVNTWKRQWFKTPGIRMLYLLPQRWTDISIPLSITPEPSEVKRVMMIRVEVITPELEAVDADAAMGLGDPSAAAKAKEHFIGLGRFAEPRLRRALSLLGDPSFGAPLLAEIASADTSGAAGE